MKYPKQIFVQAEEEQNETEYLTATPKLEDIMYDGKVAIYALVKIVERQTEVKLV